MLQLRRLVHPSEGLGTADTSLRRHRHGLLGVKEPAASRRCRQSVYGHAGQVAVRFAQLGEGTLRLPDLQIRTRLREAGH